MASYGNVSQFPSSVLVGAVGGITTMEVLMDSGAVDGGQDGGDGDTELHPGVVLSQVTATKRYTHYDNNETDGSELEQACVVLMESVKDASTGHQYVTVATHGTFNFDLLRWQEAADKTAFEKEKAPFITYVS